MDCSDGSPKVRAEGSSDLSPEQRPQRRGIRRWRIRRWWNAINRPPIYPPFSFLIFNFELRYAAAPLVHSITYPLISDLVRETVPARLPRRPLHGGARSSEA